MCASHLGSMPSQEDRQGEGAGTVEGLGTFILCMAGGVGNAVPPQQHHQGAAA